MVDAWLVRHGRNPPRQHRASSKSPLADATRIQLQGSELCSKIDDQCNNDDCNGYGHRTRPPAVFFYTSVSEAAFAGGDSEARRSCRRFTWAVAERNPAPRVGRRAPSPGGSRARANAQKSWRLFGLCDGQQPRKLRPEITGGLFRYEQF
jgi:hypothetical protein